MIDLGHRPQEVQSTSSNKKYYPTIRIPKSKLKLSSKHLEGKPMHAKVVMKHVGMDEHDHTMELHGIQPEGPKDIDEAVDEAAENAQEEKGESKSKEAFEEKQEKE